jgi:hypothetical protein
MTTQLHNQLSMYNTLFMFLQGTYAQAKHTAMKPAEEKFSSSNYQEKTNPGSSDNACSEDGKYVNRIFLIVCKLLCNNIM